MIERELMDFTGISSIQLREGINQKQLRTLQIITLAMLAGVVFILAFIIYFWQTFNPEMITKSPESAESTRIMIYVVVLIAIIQYFLAYFMTSRLLSRERLLGMMQRPTLLRPQDNIKDPVSLLLNVYQQLLIIRLAIFEGVAIMGLVILLVCIMNGSIQHTLMCWITIIPTVILLLFVYIYYPSKDKVIAWIENNLLPKLRVQ